MPNIEIERKFLVLNEDYKQLATSHYTIQQGYICKEPGRTVRVRVKTLPNGAQTAYLTIKSKPNANGFSRFEWEKEIDVTEATELLQLCQGTIIDKTRWIVPAAEEGLKWEVDEFHGKHAGLTLAEIELTSEEQEVEKPDFVGEDVTSDPRYYNANM